MQKRRLYLIISVALAIIIIGSVTFYYVTLQRPTIEAELKLGFLSSLSGTFADQAKMQLEGVELAVDEANAKGGLDMPNGKMKVTLLVRDDEMNTETATRRFKELVEMYGVKHVIGVIYGPVANTLNTLTKETHTIIMAPMSNKLMFSKEAHSPYHFAGMGSIYSLGYSATEFSVKNLNATRIYLLSRPDVWGAEIEDGVKAAASKLGATIVGRDEHTAGATDYTSFLLKAEAANADVFISSTGPGSDSVNIIKQYYAMGLYRKFKMFIASITTAVATAVPPEALSYVYANNFFYWNLTGFQDNEVVDASRSFVNKFLEKFGHPPDAYTACAYIEAKELFRAIETAGSTDPDKIVETLTKTAPTSMTVKGPVTWRISGEPVYKWGWFIVTGLPQEERKTQWDVLKVIKAIPGDACVRPLSEYGY